MYLYLTTMTHNNIIIYDDNFQQKVIKRNRTKKFTQKRRPYKTYNNASWNWNNIFIEINNLKNEKILNFFKIISNKYAMLARPEVLSIYTLYFRSCKH